MQAKRWITGALLLTAALGCRERQQTRTTETQTGSVAVERQAESSQKQSEQALEEARKAQERATEQQAEAIRAQETVKEKSGALNEARTQVERERQEAQQAQQQAQQKTQEAQQTAQQAQQRALAAQQEAQREAQRETATTGTNRAAETLSAEGTVREIRADQLVLERPGGPALRLKIDDTVPVKSGNQNAALDQISVGAQVRVQYHLEATQPVAERIDLTTSGSTIR